MNIVAPRVVAPRVGGSPTAEPVRRLFTDVDETETDVVLSTALERRPYRPVRETDAGDGA